MYCGACLRDNALVAALRRLGHSVVMAPLYLPLTLDEENQSSGAPLFYSGINVYLDQLSPAFRRAPDWLHRLLASPSLLKLASGAAAGTRAEHLGELTLSMLRGEDGNQARELDELIRWLKVEKPGVVCLSNALLIGMAGKIRRELRVPVLCSFQGEDGFLDLLPEPHRKNAWQTLAARAADVDLFIAPSRYFGALMGRRLKIAPARIKILFNGINLAGFDPAQPRELVLGYFARLCREKGLDQLVAAFLRLKKRPRLQNLKLRVGGSCGPADQPIVDALRNDIAAAGVLADVEFCPNLSRLEKQAFLRSLSVFSVPATYGEAYGLYVIEAMASAVPVVQPDHAAFPELIAATGGGILVPPNNQSALADGLELLLSDPPRARALGDAGRAAVSAQFNMNTMAQQMVQICRDAALNFPS